MILVPAWAVEKITLKPSDICIGTIVCVGNGISSSELGLKFGLPRDRRLKSEDAFSYDCFRLGGWYVLATYSAQGRQSAQPEQLIIGLTPEAECNYSFVAERNTEVPLTPISIGSNESNLRKRFGMPNRIWTNANSAHGIGQDEIGLVYGAPDDAEFVLIVVKNGAVTRIIGSTIP
jgi:hypothetical protein